ncbi:hypothetical protein SprV_0200832300 [Sparganum proliferum]
MNIFCLSILLVLGLAYARYIPRDSFPIAMLTETMGLEDSLPGDLFDTPQYLRHKKGNIFRFGKRNSFESIQYPENKRPYPVQKISPDADGAQFVKKALVRNSIEGFAKIDVHDINLKTLF